MATPRLGKKAYAEEALAHPAAPAAALRRKEPAYPFPARRPLRIYAFDPMLGRHADNKITIDVENEPLRRGPCGARIQVIDYDGAANCFYVPVNLDEPRVLITDGLEPSEADPRFHQQMVYAVAMRVLENFDRALGHRLRFRGGGPLRLFPHAFHGRNAYYDPKLVAVLFGHFRAEAADVGQNLPGQTIHTCLSHDVIAHEVTHALFDRLRPYFFEPTNADVLAFHEAFADIVAIFQHFSFPEIVARTVQETQGELHKRTPLVELASQFGYATGMGRALRDALDEDGAPDPTLYQRSATAHDRGSVLVDAVFDAFFTVYQRRIADLRRIASGGTGRLPPGDLHPDLVNRVAAEASKTAQSILTMCIRAVDYLPPVDVTFSDFLRALVTADTDLVSRDRLGQRLALIEGFRERGIYPTEVASLGEESLMWGPPREELTLPPGILRELDGGADAEGVEGRAKGVVAAMIDFARTNRSALDLVEGPRIVLRGCRAVRRASPDGQVQTEIVAQFVQTLASRGTSDADAFGGLSLRGGTTIVARDDGRVLYAISKPFHAAGRRDRLRDFVEMSDWRDPLLPTATAQYLAERMKLRASLALVHRAIRS